MVIKIFYTTMKDLDTELRPRPRPRVKLKTQIIVVFLIILIMSSGLLYYFDTSSIKPDNPWLPFLFYGPLGITVGLIIILIYLSVNLYQSPPELFPVESGAETSLAKSGLEKVLTAEKKYKDKLKKHDKKSKLVTERTLGTGSGKIGKNDRKTGQTRKTQKGRIGSIPVEDAIFKEKYDVRKKGDEEVGAQEPTKVTTFLCPSCGSKELYYEAGLISGYKYHCKDCDYIGSFVIEKDFKVDT